MVCSQKVRWALYVPLERKLTLRLFRPYLHIYSHSNELEEIGIINLDGVNVESDPQKELLLGVCTFPLDSPIYAKL